jgi:iron complex outermembrane receptor protein
LPGFYGDFTNAGKATVQGAEFEFSWRPNRQWEVNGFLAFLDAKYKEFISGGQDIAATQKFSNTPRKQLGLNLSRTDRDVLGGTLRSMLGYGYRSKVYPTTDLSETLDLQPARQQPGQQALPYRWLQHSGRVYSGRLLWPAAPGDCQGGL